MRGMSMIEVVVWIGVTIILFAGMVLAIINIYRGNSYTMERALAVTSARRGVEELVHLIREASYSDSGAYPLIAFGPNTVTFYADYDNDGSSEQVRIFLEDRQINRGIIEPSGTPAEYTGTETISTIVYDIKNSEIHQDLFTFKNASGVTVTNYANILAPTFVVISLTAHTGRNPFVSDYELRGSAFMRNLKN